MVPQQEIDRIKLQTDLVSYIQSRGITLKKSGKEYKGLCPFPEHNDTKPSFSVNPTMNLWYCFGCDVGGDIIKFVQMFDKVSFEQAVESFSSNGNSHSVSLSRAPHYRLLQQVFEFYHKTFVKDQKGLAYLKKRGIKSGEIYKTLRFGYANGSLLKTLSAELKNTLKTVGILTSAGHTKTGREFFQNCVVFPLYDLQGNLVNLYGRHIKLDQPGGVPHLFLPGPLSGLFYPPKGIGAYQETPLILSEGIIDALTLMNAGYWNTFPIYGVNGLTKDHLSFIQWQRINQVILCMDGDETGQNAVPKLTEPLRSLGVDVCCVHLPNGCDANDYFRKYTKKDFDKLVEVAQNTILTQSISPSTSSGQAPTQKEVDGRFIYNFGERSYRVLGMNLHGLDRLKVNVKIQQNRLFHIDTLDLYSSRARESFIKTTARLLGTPQEGLIREINVLIDLLENKRLELINSEPEPEKIEMSAAERKEALKFLKSKNMLKEILKDFDACGCIGEETAKLFGYLATISRFQEKPLGVLIVSRSGAGKSQLQDAISNFVPPEDLQKYTRITGQSLFYKQGTELKYKVLTIAEEKGAEDAIYSIRTLQSDQHLTVAVTITDPKTGQKKTEEYTVEGPVVIIITTTNPEALDFETRNRFVILTIDESREQTRRILKRQREEESLKGLIRASQEENIYKKHHNAQRLLKKIKVINPYADDLTYPDDNLLMRREQKKYLTLIKTIAFLHQYQRKTKTIKNGQGEDLQYIEATIEDIELANKLACEVLGRSLDELSPHTRSLLIEIKKMVDTLCKKEKKKQEKVRFTRRDVCDFTGWSYWQVNDHIKQLVEMEYLLLSREEKNRCRYELLWDGSGEDGSKFMMGLLDVKKLKGKKK